VATYICKLYKYYICILYIEIEQLVHLDIAKKYVIPDRRTRLNFQLDFSHMDDSQLEHIYLVWYNICILCVNSNQSHCVIDYNNFLILHFLNFCCLKNIPLYQLINIPLINTH